MLILTFAFSQKKIAFCFVSWKWSCFCPHWDSWLALVFISLHYPTSILNNLFKIRQKNLRFWAYNSGLRDTAATSHTSNSTVVVRSWNLMAYTKQESEISCSWLLYWLSYGPIKCSSKLNTIYYWKSLEVSLSILN